MSTDLGTPPVLSPEEAERAVLLAAPRGYCAGVDRAVITVEKALDLYGAPVYLQLDDFTEVKASVLQLTRSPGKNVVYFGCVLLVLGVFAMFYIRERRVWIWVRDVPGNPEAGAEALMAMSTQRKTLDFEKEFEALKAKLPQSA